MKHQITSRHFQLSDASKTEIETELEHLKKYAPHLEKAHVIVEKNKSGFKVEMEGKLKHDLIHAHNEHHDLSIAFNGTVDKFKTQLQKYEDKHYHNHHKKQEK